MKPKLGYLNEYSKRNISTYPDYSSLITWCWLEKQKWLQFFHERELLCNYSLNDWNQSWNFIYRVDDKNEKKFWSSLRLLRPISKLKTTKRTKKTSLTFASVCSLIWIERITLQYSLASLFASDDFPQPTGPAIRIGSYLSRDCLAAVSTSVRREKSTSGFPLLLVLRIYNKTH